MPANGPHIIPLVNSKIQYFSDSARIYQFLTRVNRSDGNTKLMIQRIFDLVDGNTSAYTIGIIEELLEEVAYNQLPKLFYTNEGEDFVIEIDLESGRDFTGYLLTARDASDGTLVSENDTAGDSYANAPTQYIQIPDLTLAANGFYKLWCNLEHPDGGNLASGDVATVLTKAFLLVDPLVDQ
jgi:hypothetical protein